MDDLYEWSPFIFIVNEADIALDNIRIEALYNMSAVDGGRRLLSNSEFDILFGAAGGTTLIVDSEIGDGLDIGVNAENCTVIGNERLVDDIESISSLIFECISFEITSTKTATEFNVSYTMDSAVTEYVDYFSAIKFDICPESTTYFPGESITFNFSVSDRLGNVMENDALQNTTITLSSGSFVGLLWIDEKGDCLLCEEVK